MQFLAPLFGLALIAIGIGYGTWRAAWLFWRGQKDHVWFFIDANTSAMFLAAITVTMTVVYFLTQGATQMAFIWAILTLLLLPLPHLIYIAGRLWGMRQRAKADELKRPAN